MMRKFTSVIKLTFCLLISYNSLGQHWSIENVAGNGTTSTTGTSPLEVGMHFPKAMALGPHGDIYFVTFAYDGSSYHGDIYKLSSDYSTIEKLVSDVYPLTGIAVDKDDNLYFSKGTGGDLTYNPEHIHKRIPSGTISPFAGNGLDTDTPPESGEVALDVEIGNAGGLRVITEPDGQEYLYYCATLGHKNYIQKINIATGYTYRVAGDPFLFDAGTYDGIDDGDDALTSQLSLSLGIGADSKGNIYYLTGAEGEDKYSIKKIIDGKIYHCAGNGIGENSGNGGLAKLAGIKTNNCGFTIVQDTMYLCDVGNNVIRKFGLSTTTDDDGIITLVAGTSEEDGDGAEAHDLDNGEYLLALNTNLNATDIVYVNGEFLFTDKAKYIRRLFVCENPVVGPISGAEGTLCKGDSVKLSFLGDMLNGGEYWRWYKDECAKDNSYIGSGTSITVPIEEDVTYYAVGLGGCAHKPDCEEVSVIVNCKEYFNTITPNTDGKNDFVEITVLDNFPINTVTFYNRWGDVLEQIENYDNSTVVWSGTNGNGDPVDSGTYYFTAVSGNELITSGWVQVIRE